MRKESGGRGPAGLKDLSRSLLSGWSSLSSRTRVAAGVVITCLVTISLLAALQVNPQGPFDARDYTRLAGMELTQPNWTALIEPLVAPLHIIIGAPDFRVALISVLIWVTSGAAIWRAIADRRIHPLKPMGSRLSGAIRTGFGTGALLFLCIFSAVFANIPGWRLTVSDPNALIFDPHSHTHASHDAFVTETENLNWHRAAGYNVAAITEHETHFSTFGTKSDSHAAASPLPALVRGIEGSYGEHGSYLIGLGIRSPYPPLAASGQQDALAAIISNIKNVQAGAVVAMSYKLSPDDVTHLANVGVDGFEIASFGHPSIPDPVRAAILKVAGERGLVLVSASDWHGWGGYARTWTVINDVQLAGLTSAQVSNLAVEAIRNRDSGHIIPVVAGYLGSPSISRIIFAPFVESIRYAKELSFIRVCSWWIWAAIVLIVAHTFRRFGHNPYDAVIALLLCITGGTFLWSGWHLIFLEGKLPNMSTYSFHIGISTFLIGTSEVAYVVWKVASAVTKTTHDVAVMGGHRPG